MPMLQVNRLSELVAFETVVVPEDTRMVRLVDYDRCYLNIPWRGGRGAFCTYPIYHHIQKRARTSLPSNDLHLSIESARQSPIDASSVHWKGRNVNLFTGSRYLRGIPCPLLANTQASQHDDHVMCV